MMDWLWKRHPNYRPVAVGEATDVRIWGVVTFVVHRP